MTALDFAAELATFSEGLTTIAITGTNGKTSTTTMLAEIIRAAGQLPVRVTTLGMWVGDEQTAADGSLESFVRTLRRARTLGARTLALEVTSRALEGGFAKRFPAQIAALTNFSRDHLDRHGTPERYLAAKAQLFLHLKPGGTAVLNALDPASELLSEILPQGMRVAGFAARPSATTGPPPVLGATRVQCGDRGTCIELAPSALAARLGGVLSLRVLGDFQADNALCAAVAAHAAGFEADAIRQGLAAFTGVPGRLEPCAREPLILVDFAHTPDALTRALTSARALVASRRGRLGCVFGCGGERDRAKRPVMGKIAAQLADGVWLTTDNPRGESATAIAEMVRAGAFEGGRTPRAQWQEEPDRRAAIEAAVRWAKRSDVLLIAGRGHETHQRLAAGSIALSDHDAVRDAIRRIT
jgi:UDP-N-acetylmuramoyl-L-alanyl-D-glutamate--2,6-diaminopimelate ligase